MEARERWWSRIALDISPLREARDYRFLWSGQLISICGTQLRYVAIAYQVYALTQSPLAVGLLGAFQAGPMIAFSLWGGVVADSVDRRKLLIVTQLGLAASSVVLAVGTQMGFASVGFIYALTAISAAFSAFDGPARQSMIPNLIERRQIPAAMALNQVMFQTATVVGPTLGGLTIANLSLAAAYWIDAVTFGAGLVAVAAIRGSSRKGPAVARPSLGAVVEGLRYLSKSRILWSTMALDFAAMFFGWPRAMFPYYAEEVFHVGPQGLGMLFAAPAAGALVGALLAGWVTRIPGQGKALLGCVALWGLAVASFGMLETMFPLALLFLAVAGAADVFSAIFRGTIVQLAAPDQLRGRITSVNMMVVISGPRLGEVESGAVSALVSPRFSVVSGGVVTMLFVVAIAALVPALAAYRISAEDEEGPLGSAEPHVGER